MDNFDRDQFLMHHAVKDGDLKKVMRLIDEGLSVDSRDELGRTPLHVAAYMGRYNIAQLLISSKCCINAVDHDGSTPVLIASFSEIKHVTDLLLRHGAKVNQANHDGFSVLHLASYHGWPDTIQHILSVEEIDVDTTTREGDTALMIAATSRTQNAGLEDCAEILLRAGADPNKRDAFNSTSLHCAVIGGRTRMVRVLLSAEGLDLNPQDDEGRTPLHLACIRRYPESLKKLLEAGADSAIQDYDEETPLSLVVKERRSLEDIKSYIQKGLFFEEKEYVRTIQCSILKERYLKDVDLCTTSVVNKFHRQSLPALKRSYFAKKLPNIGGFKLNAREISEVEEVVRCEIERHNFCKVLELQPMSLKARCILTLINY